MITVEFIFQTKHTEAILSNSTRKLLWFEITEMLTAGLKTRIILRLLFRHVSRAIVLARRRRVPALVGRGVAVRRADATLRSQRLCVSLSDTQHTVRSVCAPHRPGSSTT